MAKVKVLACTCGDCTHWEIIHPESNSAIFVRLEAIMPGHKSVSILKCKTCGAEFPATVVLDPHDKLTEVEREA